MSENFIIVTPEEKVIRIMEIGVENKITEYKDKLLVINGNYEISMSEKSVILIPPLGHKFSCKVNEEKLICGIEKSE